MPPVAAVFGAVGSMIGGAATAVISAGSAALGGLAAAGTTALGGLTAAGAGAVSQIGSLFGPGYGVTGGLIGPATKPIGYGLAELATKVMPIVQAGSQVYGMFQKPEEQPATPQPVRQPAAPTTTVLPNVLNTLPNLIRGPAPAQIITTPPMTGQVPENMLMKYAPWIAAAIVGYLLLGK